MSIESNLSFSLQLRQTSEEDNFIVDTSYSLDYIAILMNLMWNGKMHSTFPHLFARALYLPLPKPCHTIATKGRKETKTSACETLVIVYSEAAVMLD